MRVAFILSTEVVFGDQNLLNGFTGRYRSLVRSLSRSGHETLALCFGPVPDDAHGRLAVPLTVTVQVLGPGVNPNGTMSPSRGRRASDAVGLLLGRVADHSVQAFRSFLAGIDVDVVIAAAHPEWHRVLVATADHPAILLVEEDVQKDPAVSRSRLSQALRRIEESAASHYAGSPAAVAIISDEERPWAEKSFPGAQVVVVPHLLDEDTWTPPPAPPRPHNRKVLVVGRMGQVRNSEGLANVLHELRALNADVDVVVASADPLHPATRLDAGLVRSFGPVDDLRSLYRQCALTLVPAFRVSGAKTTILQGWSQYCPVIATSASGRSVGAVHGVDSLLGDSPREVAELVMEALQDHELRERLAVGGFRRYRSEYTSAETGKLLSKLVVSVYEQAGATKTYTSRRQRSGQR